MIFTRALSLILQENEGIAVKICGDSFNPNGESDLVIVYSHKNQIHIIDAPEDIKEEGRYVWVNE